MKILYLVFFIALIVGFIGCDNGTGANSTPFEGTWITGAYESTMVGYTWITKENGVNLSKGTFAYTSTVYIATVTHFWNGSSWEQITDTFTMNYVINANNTMTITNHSGSNEFNGIWAKKTNGNVTTPFEGTWIIDDYESTMVGYIWTIKEGDVNFAKGTFTYTGTVYTSTTTHYWNGTTWIIDTTTGIVTMNYVINNDNTMTISNHSGSIDFNGIWTKIID